MIENPLHVLLIEDNPGDARLVHEMLNEAAFYHFSLEWAKNLTIGFQKLYDNDYDIILLDLSLPESVGLETLYKILPLSLHIPIIILTGNDDLAISIEAVKKGAQDYLFKGNLTTELLLLSIRHAIDRFKFTHQLEGLVRERTLELEKTILKLESEIAEREKAENALIEARKIAESANVAKSHFLANMSHEFRSPLNSIIGFSEILYDEKIGPITREQKELLTLILDGGKHLLNLINDVLDLSKIEAGKENLEKETFEIEKLIENVKDLFSIVATRKNIHIYHTKLTKLQPIYGDPNKIKQVLYNLVSNAIKFTPDGGEVEIISNDKNAYLEIIIRDNGIGIDDSDIDKLFKPFSQIDDIYKKSTQGTGLGLYICKKLIELHEGTISVQSIKARGSDFIIHLPLGQNNKN